MALANVLIATTDKSVNVNSSRRRRWNGWITVVLMVQDSHDSWQ